MKMTRHIIGGLAVVMSVIFLTGCGNKTLKPSISPGNVTFTEVKKSAHERFSALVDSTPDWLNLTVPVKLTVQRPVSVSLSGRAVMVRDQSILISLRKLGFEVAQIYVTPDSLYAVDKFSRRYVAESLEGVLAKCPVNLHDIQNLLLGQPFLPGDRPEASKFTFEEKVEKAHWIALPKEQPKNLELGFVFSLNDDSLDALAVQGGESIFIASYADQVPTPGGAVASTGELSLDSEKIKVSVELDWSWGDSKWNDTDGVRQWSRPSGSYSRIAASALLKSLKGR